MRHKVKLTRKPLSKWIFLFPIIIVLISFVLLYLCFQLAIILQVQTEIILHTIPFIIVFNCICLLISYLISPICNFGRIRKKLKKVLFTNKFFSVNDYTNEIIESASFIYFWKNNKLFVEFHPNGLKCANKMNELQPLLETALKMYVEEIDDSLPNFTLYILSKNNGGNRINVSEKW